MPQEAENSILVVDDSPEQIRFASELLRPEGCRIYAASSCEVAWRLLEKQSFRLILLDIVMPGMDGFTFCKKIKQDERMKDIPVIFATAYHDAENLSKGFEVGGCDYVVKPFIREELLERVKVRIRMSQIRIELQKANAELDKFCYTLSHDIRAPLYVIKQLTQLLQQEIGAHNYEETEKICGMLIEKASRTASMADGLHKFSKALYEPLNYVEINMDELFTEVYEELSILEPERTIHFQKEPLPAVSGDIDLIRQVIFNVMSNAFKFTRKESEADIHVYAQVEHHEISYCVQDNGIGFEAKDASELFGVFRRLHQEDIEGDGIGLATVKRIVERHHGRVALYSQPEKGTCVKVTIPQTTEAYV